MLAAAVAHVERAVASSVQLSSWLHRFRERYKKMGLGRDWYASRPPQLRGSMRVIIAGGPTLLFGPPAVRARTAYQPTGAAPTHLDTRDNADIMRTLSLQSGLNAHACRAALGSMSDGLSDNFASQTVICLHRFRSFARVHRATRSFSTMLAPRAVGANASPKSLVHMSHSPKSL